MLLLLRSTPYVAVPVDVDPAHWHRSAHAWMGGPDVAAIAQEPPQTISAAMGGPDIAAIYTP